MCPPFDRPRAVIRRSVRHHAELNCFIQISALPSRKIRGPCYDSVSIEGNLVTTVTRLAASVVGGKVRCVIRCRHIECLSAERQCEGCRPELYWSDRPGGFWTLGDRTEGRIVAPLSP